MKGLFAALLFLPFLLAAAQDDDACPPGFELVEENGEFRCVETEIICPGGNQRQFTDVVREFSRGIIPTRADLAPRSPAHISAVSPRTNSLSMMKRPVWELAALPAKFTSVSPPTASAAPRVRFFTTGTVPLQLVELHQFVL
ncbi:hypothetical protein V5O48_005435 [Marasmius crinis-equi]|uniref:Uncharacterized protein n=1 Tax=Marasmius crinis-equi TaxID=585013 RepID=A0ABR3FMC3_9AGAR